MFLIVLLMDFIHHGQELAKFKLTFTLKLQGRVSCAACLIEHDFRARLCVIMFDGIPQLFGFLI